MLRFLRLDTLSLHDMVQEQACTGIVGARRVGVDLDVCVLRSRGVLKDDGLRIEGDAWLG